MKQAAARIKTDVLKPDQEPNSEKDTTSQSAIVRREGPEIFFPQLSGEWRKKAGNRDYGDRKGQSARNRNPENLPAAKRFEKK